MQLIVKPDGNVRCVYDETFDLSIVGRLTIRRASHVEPTEDGGWTADLSLCGGPLLGPFPVRSDALAAERQWLDSCWLERCR